ncbi:MAG: hypothetical protein ACYSX0_11030 [Planctomycetota bacterium]
MREPEESGRSRVAIRWPPIGTRLLLYGAIPFAVLGAMVAMYYSDSALLRRVVSPDFSWIPLDSRREFGVLESLQNLLLLGLVVVAVAGLRRKRLIWERLGLWMLLIGSAFMLLEEIDYGLQYALLFPSEEVTHEGVAGYFNIHRIGYTQTVLEHVAWFGMLTFFGAFAIAFARSRSPLMRYVAPDRFSVLTILVVTALQELVWGLAAIVPVSHGSLSGREIEYTELGIYYLILLYAVDVVFWRTYFPREKDAAPEDSAAVPAAR